MSAEPHGRTVILARGQEVTVRPGRVRGYPVAVQLGTAADLNLDLPTAIALLDVLRLRLGEELPRGRPRAPFEPLAHRGALPVGGPAHPDGPAIPGLDAVAAAIARQARRWAADNLGLGGDQP